MCDRARVLIDAPAVDQPRLVAAKRRRQETRLLEQLRSAAIRLGGWLELAGQQSIEVVDRAAETADVIVERQHLGDERRADVERRAGAALFGIARRGGEHRFALELGVARRRIGQARQQLLVQIRARADVRRAAVGRRRDCREPIVERPRQLLRGGLRRHEDERVGRRVGIERAREIDEVCAIPGQIRQREAAGCDEG